MATRPVFIPSNNPPYFVQINVDFKYYNGFSLVQNQRSIDSLHSAFIELYPNRKILEISRKSKSPLGVSLSAFNLVLETNEGSFSVESLYQSSKVFEQGGPYIDLMYYSPKEAKKDPRLKTSGNLIGYSFNNTFFPLESYDNLHNCLYISALTQHKNLYSHLLEYDAFTDIVFSPTKGIACQAKSAAIFVGLYGAGINPQRRCMSFL